MAEELTEEEREFLHAVAAVTGPKAIRIIDAHAANRAAIVASYERTLQAEYAKREALDAEVAALVAQLEAVERKIRLALELCEPYAGRLAPIVAALRGEEP